MAPVDLLRVQPEVALRCLLQRQLVVLPVVPAHPDDEPLGRAEAHRAARRELHPLLSLRVPDVSALGQLLPDLRDVPLRFCTSQLAKHALQIRKLRLALRDLLGQDFFGGLCLLIAFIVFRGVLLRRDGRVKRDRDAPASPGRRNPQRSAAAGRGRWRGDWP